MTTTNPYSGMLMTIPTRSLTALTGSQFLQTIKGTDLGQHREDALLAELLAGNIPDFMRQPVEVTATVGSDTVQYSVMPDVLCIGSDDDYVRVPLMPFTAQKVADLYNCSLPTRKMAVDIWKAADIKLVPHNLPPTAAMTTTAYFEQHNAFIEGQLKAAGAQLGQLITGHKKDVVICKHLLSDNTKVAIFGWFYTNGQPIQPLNATSHSSGYSDYVQSARLISNDCLVNGQSLNLLDILKDQKLSALLSDEGSFDASGIYR